MDRRHFTAAMSASLLAAALGDAKAEERPLWFVFLETGRKTPDDKDAVARMQRGHIDNFKRLFGERKLFAAGPLRDPAGEKRGIVVVRAASRAELMAYFDPDDYVREGYMRVNATPAHANQALNSEGIDPDGIEELRIVLLGRDRSGESLIEARRTMLRGLVERGIFGAWYTLQEGPIAEVLFARGGDSSALERSLGDVPGVAAQEVSLAIWPQWLGKGVLR
jgi:uncharacterized protein YciI